MEFSMRRFNALVKKEIKDLGKNKNVFLMCLLPLVFAFMFSFMLKNMPGEFSKAEALNQPLNMNLILVSSFAISMLIAEEKEKNTLRTLMLSAVSPVEFLMGKASVVLLLATVNNLAIYFIIGMDVQYLASYVLLSTLVAIIMIGLGAVIGLIAENQMSTGVVGMPVLMTFMMLPLLAPINDTIKKIASLLPNHSLDMLLRNIFRGEGYTDATKQILVILVWIIVVAGIFTYTYNRRRLDQ